jgi:uncharacterized protein (TIGR02687 family)
MHNIQEALKKLFDQHRIIFWYDSESQDLFGHFEEIQLPDVEKVKVENNQFYVKYLVTSQKPGQKFLLYFSQDRPADKDNWLLDLELANYIFYTDQEALFLQELELEYHFKELVSEHIEFFKNKERREKLKTHLGKDDTAFEIRYKMLAVTFGTENISLPAFLQAHAGAFINNDDKPDKALKRYQLDKFYWDDIATKYNYSQDTPGIYDFLLEVFNNNFSLGANTGISRESRLLLSLWKDTVSFQDTFRKLSDRIADDLKIQEKLDSAVPDQIMEDDLFRLIDKKIIHTLSAMVADETISPERLDQYIKQRRNKYWFNIFTHFYQGLEHASHMISLAGKYEEYSPAALDEGIEKYSQELFKIDTHYRKFIWHYRQTNQSSVLGTLNGKVEKIYNNKWLLNYNNKWQEVIDKLPSWPANHEKSQKRFFENYVKPVVAKGQRLFVVISDAFRYECGFEYFQNVQREKRFEGSMDYMLGMVPTYTQLGMAALLPHKELAIKEKTDQVLVDGQSSSGIHGRSAVLQQNSGVRATAVNAEEFMQMNASTEGRDFVKKYDLIYIFHNRIDKTGDDKISEDKVFEAAADEIAFLTDMIKKIAGMNGYNMLVTADHGFIYQHHALEESDFAVTEFSGEIWKESRRYVIGSHLKGDTSTKHFNSSDLGLAGEAEFLIPKSINRLRIKGSGSRFTHGGMSPQELIIPLISISYKKKDTTGKVGIDIIKTTDKITTNILAVSFLQTEAVSEKLLPRKIRAALHAENGELLSDQFYSEFDIAEEAARMREVKHRFQLSSKASSKYKNQRVKLVLEEPVEGSNRWTEYKSYYYYLNISFTNDFDDD